MRISAILITFAATATSLLFPSLAAADDVADVKAAYVAGETKVIKGELDAYRAGLLGKRLVIDYCVSRHEVSALANEVYDMAAARFAGQKIAVGHKRKPAEFYEEALQREVSTMLVTIDGDVATLRQPNQRTNASQHMRRVNGVWRYVAEDDIYTEKEMRREVAFHEAQITAYRETLAGIKSGKHKSAEDARVAYEDRVFKLGQEYEASQEKKSQPAAKPSTGKR